MRRLIAVVAVSLALVSSVSPAGPVRALQQSSPVPTEAATLLESSYSASAHLSEVDRLQFLNDLVIVAPNISPPEVVKDWSNELIRLARNSTVILDWSKVQFQKNAVVALSKVDPAAAMDAFSQIGSPAVSPGEKRLQEDVRAFGARTLFPNYFRAYGIDSLPRLEQEAIKLSETGGSYPFHAMSVILTQLAATGKDGQAKAEKLFANAVKYYSCDSKVENQHLEFFTFLQSAKLVLNNALLREAVQKFVHKLTDPTCDKRPASDQYFGIIHTNRGTVQFDDESKSLLFQAFSLIKEIDPDSATKLRDDKDLKNADATINEVASTFVKANLPPDKKTESKNFGLQQALMYEIGNVRESNPQAALQMSKHVEDPARHVAAVASVLPSLAQSDMQQARQLYFQELDELNSLPEHPVKPFDVLSTSQASVWMAEAAYKAQDFDTFQYLAAKTFEDGVAQFEADYEANSNSAKAPADSRDGYAELTELVEFASAHDITWLLAQAGQVQDPRLKVHLLMYAAKGLSRRDTLEVGSR